MSTEQRELSDEQINYEAFTVFGSYATAKERNFARAILAADRALNAPAPKVADQQPLSEQRNSAGETPTEHAHRWATELAVNMRKKFYPEVTHWKPFPDLLGVITQIDNMSCGLVRGSDGAVQATPGEPSAQAEPVVAGTGQPGAKLWLWKNFVDGRPEYWAFDNPFPVHLDCGDPQTLGEPCGYAIFKPSRVGRTDVSEADVLRRIKGALTPAVTKQPSELHARLMKFYGVETLAELVDAQSHHVDRLQEKLPKTPSLAPTFPRG